MCTTSIEKTFWSESITPTDTRLGTILIIDFGGQVTQKIAKILRKNQFVCTVLSHTTTRSTVQSICPLGIILSGGPASVNELRAPQGDSSILSLAIPVLGICYGMQLLCVWEGGTVFAHENQGEYGSTTISIGDCPDFLEKLQTDTLQVWMSHRDSVKNIPPSYRVTAQSTHCLAGMRHDKFPRYGLQFHPELSHTDRGEQILTIFAKDICQSRPEWTPSCMVETITREVQKKVENKSVVLALSGGVDSTALAFFLDPILNEQLTCIVVDTGLLREGEIEEIRCLLEKSNVRFMWKVIDASEYFLRHLQGIVDPEQKRTIIGQCFIDIFFQEAQQFDMLAQGTIYSDVIESQQTEGIVGSAIKTHHNRVQQILDLQREGRLLEPFEYLFKDEVRQIAKKIGVPDQFINRQPFPGPGLAVRILGEVTKEKLVIIRRADQIVREELFALHPWQYFAVLTNSLSVGVMGDSRCTGYVVAIRAIDSVDGMSANWVRIPYDVLEKCSTRICNEIPEIARVVYDITNKPPATIEWE